MASARFDSPLIHLTSATSRRLYACQRHIISIISLFSAIVPNLTRQSNRDFESVHRTSGRLIWSALSIVDFIVAVISNPWAIAYSSEASTLLVTLLHLVDDQWSMFAFPESSLMTRIYPICDKRSLLFAKDESIKTSSYKDCFSSLTKRNPLAALSICH